MASCIAIVGAHPGTKFRAPYHDREWEIWACSKRNWSTPIPRYDAWFELHYQEGDGGGVAKLPKEYIAFLKTLPLVWVRDANLNLPGQRAYPRKAMELLWGPFFFTSTIAHMMAKALAEKPSKIGLWGVHQSTKEEWAYQRQGCQYFIQKAWDMGVEVELPAESELLVPVDTPW